MHDTIAHKVRDVRETREVRECVWRFNMRWPSEMRKWPQPETCAAVDKETLDTKIERLVALDESANR
ncbi:hypothetical protein [Novipirellula galeiformis]|uniref:hypothetical protein n=1 Tax=Novipirellula galeiformis TaxID=2528004 RepID=UPI0018CFE619|nr:hypothetical protein [Novipirellula galeiformis]